MLSGASKRHVSPSYLHAIKTPLWSPPKIFCYKTCVYYKNMCKIIIWKNGFFVFFPFCVVNLHAFCKPSERKPHWKVSMYDAGGSFPLRLLLSLLQLQIACKEVVREFDSYQAASYGGVRCRCCNCAAVALATTDILCTASRPLCAGAAFRQLPCGICILIAMVSPVALHSPSFLSVKCKKRRAGVRSKTYLFSYHPFKILIE